MALGYEDHAERSIRGRPPGACAGRGLSVAGWRAMKRVLTRRGTCRRTLPAAARTNAPRSQGHSQSRVVACKALRAGTDHGGRSRAARRAVFEIESSVRRGERLKSRVAWCVRANKKREWKRFDAAHASALSKFVGQPATSAAARFACGKETGKGRPGPSGFCQERRGWEIAPRRCASRTLHESSMSDPAAVFALITSPRLYPIIQRLSALAGFSPRRSNSAR